MLLQYQKQQWKILKITQNINLKNYNFEYTSTESAAGGTVLVYKPRDDLKIYKTSELKSTFIELINSSYQEKKFFFLLTLTSIY